MKITLVFALLGLILASCSSTPKQDQITIKVITDGKFEARWSLDGGYTSKKFDSSLTAMVDNPEKGPIFALISSSSSVALKASLYKNGSLCEDKESKIGLVVLHCKEE